MKKDYYSYIDILKLFFSICIVAIHTNLLSSFNETINWYGTHMILRLAVPFFFTCSGFFYGNKILKAKNIKETTNKYIKRLIYPFLFWLSVNYIFWLKNDIPFKIQTINGKSIMKIIFYTIRAIICYPWGSLWYLLALIIAVFLCSKFYQKKRFYEPFFLGIFLYLFACISNSYHYIIENILLLNKIVEKYMNIFISSRNGIFVGIIYISLGVIISKQIKEKKVLKLSSNIVFFILSFITLGIEVYILKHHTIYEDHSLFLIMPILVSFLTIILIQQKNHKNYRKWRDYSIGIYLTHRFFLSLLTSFIKISNTIFLFLCTLSISIIFCFITFKLNNKFIKKIMLQ